MPISTALLSIADAPALTAAIANGNGLELTSDSGIRQRSLRAYWTVRPTAYGIEFVVAGQDLTAVEQARRHVDALTTNVLGDRLHPEWTEPVMGGDLDIIGPAIGDYLLAHVPEPDGILRDLLAETLRSTGRSASMQVSHEEGALLTLLTRLAEARLAVEIGTFTGYSSICIARGLRPAGRLITCDVSEEWAAIASGYWARAGLTDVIDCRIGPAIETLRCLPTQSNIDLAFIDADKEGYRSYYDELVPRLRPGGLIVLDNVFLGGRVFDPAYQEPHHVAMRELNDHVATDRRVEAVMVPVRDGLTVARRCA